MVFQTIDKKTDKNAIKTVDLYHKRYIIILARNQGGKANGKTRNCTKAGRNG